MAHRSPCALKSADNGRSTLLALIALGIANHVVLTGSRITVTLEAIKLGYSTAIVGVLVALYAFLPMLCAVAAGRPEFGLFAIPQLSGHPDSPTARHRPVPKTRGHQQSAGWTAIRR